MTQKRKQPPPMPPFNGWPRSIDEALRMTERLMRPGAALEDQMRNVPEFRAPPPPANPNPFHGHFERHMADAPDLSIPAARMGSIDAARARQAGLQEWLAQRAAVIAGAGFDADLVGVEFLQLTHKACGMPWLVPVAAGLPNLVCPYCRPSMGGR